MRGPSFRKLIRSLRTKSYAKLEIFGHIADIDQRAESSPRRIKSGQQLNLRLEPHGKINRDQDVIRDSRSVSDGKA